MQRFFITHGIVLHTYRIGEIHKGVVFLTSDQGLVTAVAHGAKKVTSRLRSASETFCLSQLHLYRDPTKDSQKITEAQVEESFSGLRISLPRYYNACLWAEIVMKTFGAGDHGSSVYGLLSQSLQILNEANPDKIPYLSFQFLWRFLDIAGLKPDLHACAQCGREFGDSETVCVGGGGSGFFCRACEPGMERSVPLGARKYLSATEGMTLSRSLGIGLAHSARKLLETALFGLLEGLLETRLNSVRFIRSVG